VVAGFGRAPALGFSPTAELAIDVMIEVPADRVPGAPRRGHQLLQRSVVGSDQVGEMLILRLIRDADDADDNSNGNALLHSVGIRYTAARW
jgi:hypothetical protein